MLYKHNRVVKHAAPQEVMNFDHLTPRQNFSVCGRLGFVSYSEKAALISIIKVLELNTILCSKRDRERKRVVLFVRFVSNLVYLQCRVFFPTVSRAGVNAETELTLSAYWLDGNN